MARGTWCAIVWAAAVGACQAEPAGKVGPAGCWQEEKGLCQEWTSPTPDLEATCTTGGGKWVFPTCLSLDAIATCTSSVRDSQIFYGPKFTPQQAQADCAARTGFNYATGNERTVIVPRR
jgi:hypothetical protein